MGSREDFARLLKFVEHADLHPVIDSAYAIDDAHLAFSKIVNGRFRKNRAAHLADCVK